MLITSLAALVAAISINSNGGTSMITSTTDYINQSLNYAIQVPASNVESINDVYVYFDLVANTDNGTTIQFQRMRAGYNWRSDTGSYIYINWDDDLENSVDMANFAINLNYSTTTISTIPYLDKNNGSSMNITKPSTQYSFTFNVSFHLMPSVATDGYVGNGDYASGYQSGYYDGYNAGKTNGYNEGISSNTNSNYTSGYNTGYNAGYNDGVAVNTPQFTTLFGAIADTPVLMIRSLFNFDLFGTSMLTIVLSLFTLLVVLHVAKKVIKG